VELYIRSPNTPSWRGAQLKKIAQGQLYRLPLPLSEGLTPLTQEPSTGSNHEPVLSNPSDLL